MTRLNKKLTKEELLQMMNVWKRRLIFHEQWKYDKIFDEPNERAYKQLKKIVEEHFSLIEIFKEIGMEVKNE